MITQEANYEPLFDLWRDLVTSDTLNAAIVNTLSRHVWEKGYNELIVTMHIEPASNRRGTENHLSFTACTELTEYSFEEKEEKLFGANQNEYWRRFMTRVLETYYSDLTDGTVELTLTLEDNGDVTYSHAGL